MENEIKCLLICKSGYVMLFEKGITVLLFLTRHIFST